MTVRVFIGYDSKEVVAYHVLAHSIIEHASVPVMICPIALDGLGEVDFDAFNQRKSRSLLELSRLSRRPPAHPDAALRQAMDRVRGKLDRNQSAIQRHLGAVAEIADMMATALHEAESDGTYSSATGRSRAQ